MAGATGRRRLALTPTNSSPLLILAVILIHSRYLVLSFSPLNPPQSSLAPMRKVATLSYHSQGSFKTFSLERYTLRSMASTDDANESFQENTMVQALLNLIGSTTSILVSGVFFLVLAYRRDALMVSFFIGSILNGISSKVLKKVLNQDRPEDIVLENKPNDKGMPSSHAMSLGFIGTFTALIMMDSWTWRLALLLYVTISLAYRIQTKLHTWQQVAVGVVVGSFSGVCWTKLCDGSLEVNVVEWVSSNLLNSQGVLPAPLLVVPVLVGALLVGSFERRISKFLDSRKQNKGD